MQVKVVLFGMMRERLAKESRGRLTVHLPEGATINNLLEKLEIPTGVICSLNGEIQRNFDRTLKDGEEIQLVQPVGGGSVRTSGKAGL